MKPSHPTEPCAQAKSKLVLGLAALFAFATVAPVALAADLDAGQQKLLAEAQNGIKQIESNLKLAKESAGKGPGAPKGSKAKLAMLRLNSAKQPVPQVKARLEKLPADNADVAAAQQQLDGLVAEMDALEQRITGKSAAENQKANEGVKLDYKQEEQLKNARFYIKEIQGNAKALEQYVEKVRPIQDHTTIDHREMIMAANTINKINERVPTAREHLSELPADGRGVQAANDDLNNALKSVNASIEFLRPIHEEVMGLVNPANYPELQADLGRLGDLARMYSNTQIFETDRPRAAAVIKEAPAAIAERDRVAKKYAILIQQQTDEGNRVASMVNHLTTKYLEFAAAQERFKEILPQQLRAEIDEARSIAKQAVEEQKPAFFAHGIPQHMSWVDEKLALYEVIDPDGAQPYKTEVVALRKELKQGETSLREQIIAENNLPGDEYAGDDRKEIEKLATDALKKIHPSVEILMIRIPSKEWKHDVLWRFQNGTAYKIDRSKLQAQVIVKHDDKLAEIQPVDLWKDHLSNDATTATPLFDKDWELQPNSFMLLEKVKS